MEKCIKMAIKRNAGKIVDLESELANISGGVNPLYWKW
jgi:hypothetical protein